MICNLFDKSGAAARLLAVALALLAALSVASVEARAQQTMVESRATAVVGRAERELESLKAELEALKEQLARPDVSMEELAERRAELEAIRGRALSGVDELARPLAEARQQLAQLGDAPGEGESEAEAIAETRQELSGTLAELEAFFKQYELLALEAGQLSTRLVDRERENFLRSIFRPGQSVLDPRMWIEGARSFPQVSARFASLVSTVATPETAVRGTQRLGVVAIAVTVVATVILIFLLWKRWRRLKPSERPPDDLRRLWRAIRIAFYSAILIGGAIFLVHFTLSVFALNQPRLAGVLDALALSAMVAAVGAALARGVFRPGAPRLRLINIDDAGANRSFQLLTAISIVGGLNLFLAQLAEVLFLPLAFLVPATAVVSIALILLIASFLLQVRQADPYEIDPQEEPGRRFYFGWTQYLLHPIWLFLLIATIALIASYTALGHFILTNLVETGLLVAGLYMIHNLVDAVVNASIDPASRMGRLLRTKVALSNRGISRLGVLASTLVDLVIVLIGIPLVLAQLAVTWIDYRSLFTTAFFGFRVGDVTIKPSSILMALVILTLGLLFARAFTLWLDRRVLARTAMDSGLRNSVRTGASYATILIAAGLALTSAGLAFSNVAIIAGALSVGIGFGLQSIVNNFVSGLILLAERPIKVGDWISLSDGEGIVRNIKVRSTEIETFDRCSIIVPNSTLITESVSNWYHNGMMGRVRVPIGVSYDSDPEHVREVLLECVRENERVSIYPEPMVLFMGFGDSSLDFEVRAYIDDVGWVLFVGSDLRFAIFKALKQAGIEIPFPQRDLHVRSVPAGALPGEPVAKPERSLA